MSCARYRHRLSDRPNSLRPWPRFATSRIPGRPSKWLLRSSGTSTRAPSPTPPSTRRGQGAGGGPGDGRAAPVTGPAIAGSAARAHGGPAPPRGGPLARDRRRPTPAGATVCRERCRLPRPARPAAACAASTRRSGDHRGPRTRPGPAGPAEPLRVAVQPGRLLSSVTATYTDIAAITSVTSQPKTISHAGWWYQPSTS
jgi:hypothetical protein